MCDYELCIYDKSKYKTSFIPTSTFLLTKYYILIREQII